MKEVIKYIDNLSQKNDNKAIILTTNWINTILGPMIAVTDDSSLYLLEFIATRRLEQKIDRLRHRGFGLIPGNTLPLASIKEELKAYFEGKLSQFKTPYRMFGSPFQQQVWQSLCQIPYGETRSYKEQSISLGKPNGYRAAANANGANQLAIIIPCHRVIASNGSLGGYGGGLRIKQLLIKYEQQYKNR